MKRIILILLSVVVMSSVFAQSPLRVVHLGTDVNTTGNETAPLLLPDGELLFSRMPYETNEGGRFRLDEALMYLMSARVADDGSVGVAERVKAGSLTSARQHVGNTAYDARNETLYFTRCVDNDDGSNTCVLYLAERNGSKWRRAKELGYPVNVEGYTTTHPAVAYTPEGKVILYFASNRPGGIGRMDIWYTIIEGGKPAMPVNLGEPVNSSSNEYSPFYDNRRQVLYFSSDRQGGVGGYDVYASHGSRNGFTRPVAMPQPINSPHNDMFYVVADEAATYGYLSSNRKGAIFATDSFCCNDIFMWTMRPENVAMAEPEPDEMQAPPDGADSIPLVEQPPSAEPDRPYPVNPVPNGGEGVVEPSPNNPIVLYFDNDMPNPGSLDTVTKESYDSLIGRYLQRLPVYKNAWSEGRDSVMYLSVERELDAFFANEVEGNYKRLESFMWRMAEHLWSGRKVTLTIRGFASPVSSSAYNANLSQRRIVSFINYLNGWNQGNLRRSIKSGLLQIKEVPFGSSTASRTVSSNIDDPLGSVYSIGAARERRVEIINFMAE